MNRCEASDHDLQCLQDVQDHRVSYVDGKLFLTHTSWDEVKRTPWTWETRA